MKFGHTQIHICCLNSHNTKLSCYGYKLVSCNWNTYVDNIHSTHVTCSNVSICHKYAVYCNSMRYYVRVVKHQTCQSVFTRMGTCMGVIEILQWQTHMYYMYCLLQYHITFEMCTTTLQRLQWPKPKDLSFVYMSCSFVFQHDTWTAD